MSDYDYFWYNVSICRKFVWCDNPEVPFEFRECSEELVNYIKNMNYDIVELGPEWWVYPKWNAVLNRPL